MDFIADEGQGNPAEIAASTHASHYHIGVFT
jgi:hypothetical protein